MVSKYYNMNKEEVIQEWIIFTSRQIQRKKFIYEIKLDPRRKIIYFVDIL